MFSIARNAHRGIRARERREPRQSRSRGALPRAALVFARKNSGWSRGYLMGMAWETRKRRGCWSLWLHAAVDGDAEDAKPGLACAAILEFRFALRPHPPCLPDHSGTHPLNGGDGQRQDFSTTAETLSNRLLGLCRMARSGHGSCRNLPGRMVRYPIRRERRCLMPDMETVCTSSPPLEPDAHVAIMFR
jgi:hypothetical protein